MKYENCQADGSGNGNCENCVDLNPLCHFWATAGECENNPRFMEKNCRISCFLCEGPLIDDPDCKNRHSMCPSWAKAGECIFNPVYMEQACQEECAYCVSVTHMKANNKTEDQIRQHYRFVKEPRGEVQKLGETQEEKDLIRPVLLAMTQYAKENATILPLNIRKRCYNSKDDCAHRVALKECETNTNHMMLTCPLACQACHDLERFHKCHDKRPIDAVPSIKPGGITQLYETLITQYNMTLASITTPVTDLEDPWVLTLDHFVTPTTANALITWMKGQEWTPAVPSTPSIRRQGKVAYCQTTQCRRDPLYLSLLANISSLLSIPSHYIEPLEFVHYSYLQSYGMHHDFSWKDMYLPAGPRLMSLYLGLSSIVQGGGATGFPDLDWLSIPPKPGQLLIWPNVKNDLSPSPLMSSESLPVIGVDTDKYGIHVWVRNYDYDFSRSIECVQQ